MNKPKVAIAGAGIGGLTLAIELGLQGYPVTLFEQATKFERHGAGIILAPNATFLLNQVGILCELSSGGQLLSSLSLRTPKGRTLSYSPGKMTVGNFHFPLLALHRAHLQKVLRDAALRCPNTRLFMGAPLHDFRETES